MHRAVHVIVDSWHDWYFKMISGKDLRGLINESVFFIIILSNVILDFIKINIRSPWIHIDNGQKYIISRYYIFVKNGLKMLGTPGYIRGFSFLLILFDLMSCVIHQSELCFKLLNYLFRLPIWSFFMLFHSQKYQIVMLSPLVFG